MGENETNEIIILNSIKEARNCVFKKLHHNRSLFTTHASVNLYLNQCCNLDSVSIDSFFSDAEMKDNMVVLGHRVDELLLKLDRVYSRVLNERYDLNIRYFQPLYSYYGKHHFAALFYFIEAIKRISAISPIDKVFSYNRKLNSFIDGTSDIHSIARSVDPNITVEIIEFEETFFQTQSDSFKVGFNTLGRAWVALKKIYESPSIIKTKARDYFSKYKRKNVYDDQKQTILMQEPLYDLDFLQDCFDSYNVLAFSDSMSPKKVSIRSKNRSVKEIINIDLKDDLFEPIEPIDLRFLQDIESDINKHIDHYISNVELLKHEKIANVVLGIWGNPPANKKRGLLFESLLAKGIPVIGAQHGSGYGEINFPWHFDTDFNRCSYYLTWGFTKQDLERLYPETPYLCSIIPIGRAKDASADPSRKKQQIDILFPITNTLSVFDGGMARLGPGKLAERQIQLLEYLNGLESLTVTIKPFMWATPDTCGPLLMGKRLRGLKIENHLDLSCYLQKTTPRVVLIEYPSTPLYECLPMDTEIFLLNDPVLPFESNVLETLKKRVHYSETVEEIIGKINLFFDGQLESKRDDSFFNHYAHGKSPKNEILKQIDKIIQT